MSKKIVLVTGGTGFLGKRLIHRLVTEGYSVRAVARRRSNTQPLEELGVEVFIADVADKDSLQKAFEGIDVLVHAAAGTSGKKEDCESATIQGTRNVLDLCNAYAIEKLVYISSCSVYGVADYSTNQTVTEQSGLERFPSRRGYYAASKQQAEQIVLNAMKAGGRPIVVLRPGTIYGPGGKVFTRIMGLSLANKIFLVFGNGRFELPLVYIDNLIDAILQAISNSIANNQIFNVVDTERITKKLYIEELVKKLYRKSYCVYLPYSFLYCLTWAQEQAFGVLRKTPFLTRYRLISSQRQIKYDTSKIASEIGWQPRITFNQAVAEIVSHWQKS
ncbi:MAG: NAD(P)-dependent oxidoreductase [Nitrososphaera sp.]|nr:NAD(P)-dependent oxidoreductase [Nitrososphaera sp.]